MNKYQNQILTNQPQLPKKPAHLKKNPLAHAAWLAAKKARNQAQYFKRDPLATRCLICYTTKVKPPLKHWIEEKHYQSNLGISKVIFAGDNPSVNATQDNRQYLGSAYYCSLTCFNFKAKQTEREDYVPGKCSACKIDLVVLNARCKELNHQKEMKYLPINPACWKGGGK